MPARASTKISLRANLSAGKHVEQTGNIFALDSAVKTPADGVNPMYDSDSRLTQKGEDFAALFNQDGDAFTLTENQGIWVSYKTSEMRNEIQDSNEESMVEINGTTISFTNDSGVSGMSSIMAAQMAINAHKHETGVEAYVDNGLLRLENKNELDGDERVKNIRITASGTGAFANFVEGDADITSFRYRYTSSLSPDSGTGQFRTTEDLRALMQYDANLIKDPTQPYADSTASVSVKVNKYGMFEIQNKDKPGYPLPKRGIYYGSRMISAQRGTIFKDQEYGKIKKVVSIWICENTAVSRSDSINEYLFTERCRRGEYREEKSNYDLMRIIVMRLGAEGENSEDDAIRLLSSMFSPRHSAEDKKKLLSEEFHIELFMGEL